MDDQNDKILKEMAERYADAYGASLLSELRQMEKENVRYLMPRADEQIRKLAGRRKRRSRTIGWVAAIAACLVLVVSLPRIISTLPGPGNAAPGMSAAPGMEEAPSQSGSPSADWNQIQRLSFALPDEFAVSNAELDNGMTIYRLDGDAGYDNVVLTLQEPPDRSIDDLFSGMEIVTVHGDPVPAKIDEEYKLLTFENDGTLYTLSCKDDVGTLAYLYSCIVEA
jgi:hypothetical protein